MNSPQVRSIGLARLGEILRTRWYWIGAGLLVGALIGAVLAFANPLAWRAATTVQIVELDADLTPGTAKDVSTTEETIARSARTLDAAAAALGPGHEPLDLRHALEVDKDPEGGIVELTVADTDREAARRASQAVADAYLEARTALAAERVEARRGVLDVRIGELTAQAAGPADSPAAEASGDALADLVAERAALPDPDAPAGTVLTPAQAHEVWPSVDRSDLVLAGAAAGAAVGLALALLAAAVARRPAAIGDVAAWTGAPAWDLTDPSTPTRLATQVAAVARGDGLTLLAAPDAPGLAPVHDALAERTEVDLVDPTDPGALAHVTRPHAVLAADRSWRRADLRRWAEDLAALDVDLLGVVVRPGRGK